MADNMRAFQKSTVVERILLYFASRTSRNEELKATIRSRFEHLIEQQTESEGTYSDNLSVRTVSKLVYSELSAIELDKVVRAIDLDGDGEISYDEFQSAMLASMAQQDTEMLEHAFKQLDIDGDGFLDHYELTRMVSD